MEAVSGSGMHPFLPTPRQTNFLLLLGFVLLGVGLYLRLQIVESEPLAAACFNGLARASCGLRRFVLELHALEVFGGIALIAAAVHFVRPDVVAFSVALCAAILGLFLDNVVPSAFAAAILVMGFARPVRGGRPRRARREGPRTTPPASSRVTH
jgi:hypothetical protein